jgi:thiamine pyrophosphokinase
MKICYIIGAGDLPLLYINEKSENLIIAADGGYEALGGITPDIVVGDFDSLGYLPDLPDTVALPVEKDVTDMRQAVDIGFDRGFDTFLIYGGTGGRPDHTFANYALLSLIREKGGRAYLIGDGYMSTVISNEKYLLPQKAEGTVSVFALCSQAEGVSIEGLKYTLHNHTLSFSHPLGVSNSFTGKNASVSVKNGSLLLMWEEKSLQEFVDNL